MEFVYSVLKPRVVKGSLRSDAAVFKIFQFLEVRPEVQFQGDFLGSAAGQLGQTERPELVAVLGHVTLHSELFFGFYPALVVVVQAISRDL